MGSGKNSVLGIATGVLVAQGAPKAIKGARKLLYRWRRALTPLWFAGLVWLASVIMRWQIPEWWPVVLVFPVLGIGLAWAGPRLGDRWTSVVMAVVPQGLDSGRDGVLDRPVERIYFGSLLTYLGAYMVLRIVDGPSDFSMWMWISGVVLWGGTWWYHRRIRVAGRADRFAKKWPILADKETCPFRLSPLVDSKVVKATSRGKTSVLVVRLAPSQTADAITHLTGALASYFNLRKRSVFISDDEEKARYVRITFLPKDPWKGKIPHPVFAEGIEPGSISLRELRKRFAMGLLAHGEPLFYELQHTLVVGASGSGKSIWLHSLMTWLTACRDCIVVGVDMAAGATLGVWRKALALPLATDVEAAIVILERVLGVIRDREIQLGLASEDDDDAADAFEPSEKTPWLVLVIDEFPDLLAEAKMTTRLDENGKPNGTFEKYVITLLSRIAKKARKCGVRLVFASQNGTKTDLGSKEMQAQLRAIVGLNLDTQQSRNLWGDLTRLGWKSTDLKEGQFLLRDDEHGSPDPAKGFFVANRDRRDHVAKAEALHKALEPTAWNVLMGLAGESDYIDAEVVPEPRESEENEVLQFLRLEGPSKAEPLVERLGVSRATIYRRLKRLAEANLVYADNGTWHAVKPERTETGTAILSIQGEQQG